MGGANNGNAEIYRREISKGYKNNNLILVMTLAITISTDSIVFEERL